MMNKTDGTIIQFLNGSHSYEGVWFGDKHPTRKGAFWWRSILASSFQSPSLPEHKGGELYSKEAVEWISVGNWLPDYYKAVIVYDMASARGHIAWLASDGVNNIWTIDNSNIVLENVTHWKYLPVNPINL